MKAQANKHFLMMSRFNKVYFNFIPNWIFISFRFCACFLKRNILSCRIYEMHEIQITFFLYSVFHISNLGSKSHLPQIVSVFVYRGTYAFANKFYFFSCLPMLKPYNVFSSSPKSKIRILYACSRFYYKCTIHSCCTIMLKFKISFYPKSAQNLHDFLFYSPW